MTRILLILAAFGVLASCAQYQGPKANCFNLLGSKAPIAPDCHFMPLSTPENEVET